LGGGKLTLRYYLKASISCSQIWAVIRCRKKASSLFEFKNFGDLFCEFENKHPDADFFMLDGSHRTTALTLNKYPIQAILIKSDNDIKKAKGMLERGELFGLTIGNSFEECVKNLTDHFFRKPGFQTVLEKTQKMVDEEAIPSYMSETFFKIK
jgi:hypothetical protein